MKFFDVLMPIGRTNRGLGLTAKNYREVFELMDRFDVSEALVYHTVARDSDPILGNITLERLFSAIGEDKRGNKLYKIWAYECADVTENLQPDVFLRKAIEANVKAIMINPLVRNISLVNNVRINVLANLLEQKNIPLILCYRQWDAGQDVVNWYELADFCNSYPNLPVICRELRSRSNRPLFDALRASNNLIISLSSIWQAQMLELLVSEFGAERIVFSLGLPELDPGMFQAVVRYAKITEEDKNKIANQNVMNIIRNAKYEN